MGTENISIAAAYLNRLKQTQFTLERLVKFDFKGEIVIADDHSVPEQSARLLIDLFPSLDIKVVTPIQNVVNPAHAYNTAFANCTRDTVIIQNPECVWVQDIGAFVSAYLNENDYFVFACLNGSKEDSERFGPDTDLSLVMPTDPRLPWYQHSSHRKRGYHFCSAISRIALNTDLRGGFDERFNEGYGYDDNEFFLRVSHHLNVTHIDRPYVIHQYHDRFWESDISGEKAEKRSALNLRNFNLFQDTRHTYGTDHYCGLFPNN